MKSIFTWTVSILLWILLAFSIYHKNDISGLYNITHFLYGFLVIAALFVWSGLGLIFAFINFDDELAKNLINKAKPGAWSEMKTVGNFKVFISLTIQFILVCVYASQEWLVISTFAAVNIILSMIFVSLLNSFIKKAKIIANLENN